MKQNKTIKLKVNIEKLYLIIYEDYIVIVYFYFNPYYY